MREIMAVVIVATIALTIYRLFELFARRKERMAMIEKLSLGVDPQSLRTQLNLPLYSNDYNYGSWAIRIGLLLIGVGVGVVVATVVDLFAVAPSTINERMFNEFRNTISILYPACAAIFGGLGLVIAYFIEKKQAKKD